ncbi:hypothetical protein K7X08_022671 [Anisodus acutangulus]|uniref:Uncharacterized protein n=1 Tax=Anisodus acutangulus TaxID=402998 RepID=A0A9Q1MLA7_9SOLA|nr:hypothetical protein K7X08_022671 [Anisodus acutangulus]
MATTRTKKVNFIYKLMGFVNLVLGLIKRGVDVNKKTLALVNDGDSKDAKRKFYLQVDGVQKSCGEVNKKRTIDANILSKNFEIGSQSSNDVCSFQSTDSYVTLVNDGDNKDKDDDDDLYLQVDGAVNKKRRIDVQKIHVLEVEYTFDDSDIQEILNTLMEFLTSKRGFHNKVDVLDGKIQEFREVKSGLKIVNLKKENVTFSTIELMGTPLVSGKRKMTMIQPEKKKKMYACILQSIVKNA